LTRSLLQVRLSYVSAIPVNVLAVDIGQSGSRVRSTNGFEFSDGPPFIRENGITEAVKKTLLAAGSPKANVLSLSLTGVRGLVPDPHEVGVLCNVITGANSVAVMDDGLAALAGALGGNQGLAIAVGSGVVAVASKDGRVSHRDGDGPILGDDGGGFWLGREGLRAAVKALEDRGPQTTLLTQIESKFGSLYSAIRQQADADIMRWCIEAAPIVLRCASEGDAEAVRIRAGAVSILAETVASAWRGVASLNAQAPASYTGGVLVDAEFREQFFKSVSKVAPNLTWQQPIGDNLDGALFLAQSERKDLPPLLRWWLL